MNVRILCCLLVCGILPTVALADLSSLAREFTTAKASIKGKPEEQAKKARSQVLPVARKIAKLGTKESLNFLLQQMQQAERRQPVIAAACGRAIAASGDANGLRRVLGPFGAKPPVVQAGILQGLAESKESLQPYEGEIIRAARAVRAPEAKESLPGALAKLDNVAAAQVLISMIKPRSRGKAEKSEAGFRSAVRSALASTKSEDLKEWIATKAFALARSDGAKAQVVAGVAGDLKLEDARGELEKLMDNRDPEVATTALQSLVKIGVGSSASKIASSLNKRRAGSTNYAYTMHALDAIAAAGTPEAFEVLMKFAKGKDPTLRAIAMGSLADMKTGASLKLLVSGLKDKDSSVRSNALRALARRRSKAMIGPLIEYMGSEKEKRLQVDAFKLLARLTGQNAMGLVAEDWQKWWEVAEAKFEFPKEGDSEFTQVQAYDLEYFGIEISSSRIAFVADISSSMREKVAVKKRGKGKGGEAEVDGKGKTGVRKPKRKKKGGDIVKDGKAMKIDILKKELARVIKILPAATQINLVTFDANFKVWQKQLQPIAGNGRARAVRFVEGINTGSGTNVYDSLEATLKDRRVDTIYLLTDGNPTRGKYTDSPTILKEIAVQNRIRGATIHCIAFGAESQLLKDIAKQNGGKYRFVDSY